MGLFDSDKQMIKDLQVQAVEELGKECVKLIAKNAPIWSGEYVSSITVETGPSPESHARRDDPVIEEPVPVGMRQAMRSAAIAKGTAQVKAAAETKRIHIGNSAPHAHKVEMKRAIYFGTLESVVSRADQIVARAEAKVKK